jgi:hypothetical protein
MEITRRKALQIGALGVGAAALGGCRQAVRAVAGDDIPQAIALPDHPVEPEIKVLNRSGFGPRPGDLALVSKQGVDAYLESQLDANQADPLDLQLMLRRLDVYRMDASELRDIPEAEIIRQLQQAALLRAVYSPNQLKERMADFWTNHFNIYSRKDYSAYRLGQDESKVIREHVLGSFPAMLRSSAKSPAMLVYLDNTSNFASAPNENYARELLELHTLGVDGGYTQRDIQEVARCFSGWTLENQFLRPRGRLKFVKEQHDDGAKTVLGRKIPAGQGEKDVGWVLDILTEHPSTARYLARKLVAYLTGHPSPTLERRVAAAYQTSNGDIKAMLRPILASSEFREGPPAIKRPFDFVASALRATAADTPASMGLQAHLKTMGQPLHEWPMPDGYPVDFASWTGSLLGRWNFAAALAQGKIADVKPRVAELRERFEGSDTAFCCATIFGLDAAHPAMKRIVPTIERHFARAQNGMQTAIALCLASPEFQWK